MATTITLKNIPEPLYNRLKSAAEAHRRSLNSEVLFCLESLFEVETVSAQQRIERARALRSSLASTEFTAEDIARFKEEGRR